MSRNTEKGSIKKVKGEKKKVTTLKTTDRDKNRGLDLEELALKPESDKEIMSEDEEDTITSGKSEKTNKPEMESQAPNEAPPNSSLVPNTGSTNITTSTTISLDQLVTAYNAKRKSTKGQNNNNKKAKHVNVNFVKDEDSERKKRQNPPPLVLQFIKTNATNMNGRIDFKYSTTLEELTKNPHVFTGYSQLGVTNAKEILAKAANTLHYRVRQTSAQGSSQQDMMCLCDNRMAYYVHIAGRMHEKIKTKFDVKTIRGEFEAYVNVHYILGRLGALMDGAFIETLIETHETSKTLEKFITDPPTTAMFPIRVGTSNTKIKHMTADSTYDESLKMFLEAALEIKLTTVQCKDVLKAATRWYNKYQMFGALCHVESSETTNWFEYVMAQAKIPGQSFIQNHEVPKNDALAFSMGFNYLEIACGIRNASNVNDAMAPESKSKFNFLMGKGRLVNRILLKTGIDICIKIAGKIESILYDVKNWNKDALETNKELISEFRGVRNCYEMVMPFVYNTLAEKDKDSNVKDCYLSPEDLLFLAKGKNLKQINNFCYSRAIDSLKSLNPTVQRVKKLTFIEHLEKTGKAFAVVAQNTHAGFFAIPCTEVPYDLPNGMKERVNRDTFQFLKPTNDEIDKHIERMKNKVKVLDAKTTPSSDLFKECEEWVLKKKT